MLRIAPALFQIASLYFVGQSMICFHGLLTYGHDFQLSFAIGITLSLTMAVSMLAASYFTETQEPAQVHV